MLPIKEFCSMIGEKYHNSLNKSLNVSNGLLRLFLTKGYLLKATALT